MTKNAGRRPKGGRAAVAAKPYGTGGMPWLRRLFMVIMMALAVGAVATVPDLDGSTASIRRADDATIDDKATFDTLQNLAAMGDARAEYTLAFLYLRGKGVAQDDAKAVVWLRKSAEQGLAQAQYSLAILYHVGLGVRQSDASAMSWFRKAAEQGHSKAQDTLAFMYMRGEGAPRNEAEAEKWLRLAAAHDHIDDPMDGRIDQRAEPPQTIGPANEKTAAVSSPDTPSPAAIVPAPTKREEIKRHMAKLAMTVERAVPSTVPKAIRKVNRNTNSLAAAIKQPAAPTGGDFRVQLGAVKLKARAVKEAGRLNRLHGPVLGDLKVVPVRASLGKRGIFYRLRAGPLEDRAAADALCRKLSLLNQKCLVTRR